MLKTPDSTRDAKASKLHVYQLKYVNHRCWLDCMHLFVGSPRLDVSSFFQIICKRGAPPSDPKRTSALRSIPTDPPRFKAVLDGIAQPMQAKRMTSPFPSSSRTGTKRRRMNTSWNAAVVIAKRHVQVQNRDNVAYFVVGADSPGVFI